MTDRAPPDAPTGADLARLRAARQAARAAMVAADRRWAVERDASFRCELSATVRSVSPFLATLVEAEGLTLQDVVARIVSTPGWPVRPRLSRVLGWWGAGSHALRHAVAAVETGRLQRKPESMHGFALRLRAGGWAHVRVVAHSVEVATTIGNLRFETRFGELRLTVRGGLPSALAADALGRPLDDFVLHPATCCKGWRVDVVETVGSDTALVVVTGSLPLHLE